MRELKFRAWIPSEKAYEYEPIVEDDENFYQGSYVRLNKALAGGGDALGGNGEMVFEQYTGLKDKNGKEIYEGDILESTWNGDRAVVVWNDVEGEWEHYADFNTHSKYSGSVVIGNIHENQDLLGGTNVTNKEEEE